MGTESLGLAREIAKGDRHPPYGGWNQQGVHPHVQSIVHSTGGYMYQECVGQLDLYPIPRIRVQKRPEDLMLLDVGCNWGRWTLSAAKSGIPVIGIDPSLHAVLAARAIAKQLKLKCRFVVGDARWLPFSADTFTDVFSYSVIQHFSKENAAIAVSEAARVMKPGGKCLIQMPNRFGIRSLYRLAKRGFAAGQDFDVRYYTPGELKRLFRAPFGNAKLSVDGFGGLGIQPDDWKFMSWRNRCILGASEFLRGCSRVFPPLLYGADSLYITSTKK